MHIDVVVGVAALYVGVRGASIRSPECLGMRINASSRGVFACGSMFAASASENGIPGGIPLMGALSDFAGFFSIQSFSTQKSEE